MTKKLEIYKCNVCGNITQVLHTGDGELVCCGKPMILQIEKITEEGNEKHMPILSKTENGVEIKVGSIPHPMEEEHYIEWVEIQTEKDVAKKFLKPGEDPKAIFTTEKDVKIVRSYCNVHGLWKNE